MSGYTILVIEDEKLLGESIQAFLSEEYDCVLFDTVEKAQCWLKDNTAHLVVSDIKLPGQSGLDFLRWTQLQKLNISVIFITAYSSIKNAVDAIKQGASDYISKPLDLEELEFVIRRTLKSRKLNEEVEYHRRRVKEEPNSKYFLGSSQSSKEVEQMIQRLVHIEQMTGETPSILITGETGTGKGALARHIHKVSPRNSGPLIECNCTAIPESMFESEFFGHEKGAFTGALQARTGFFELAIKGALFIDEIGHAPLNIQAKLLKVIEDKEVRRIGGNKAFSVNTRLIVATNLDLEDAIEKNEFRDDLYHRLSLIRIHIKPLRERPEDIRLLAQAFLNEAKQKYQCFGPELTEGNLKCLLRYPWPGNVRELRNEIERSILLYDGAHLSFTHLQHLQPTPVSAIEKNFSFALPPEGVDLSKVEKRLLEQALLQMKTNLSQAAKLLSISRDEMRYRVEKYQIDLESLEGWIEEIPIGGIELERFEQNLLQQALDCSKGNVTKAARLLNTTRETLRYRLKKYNLNSIEAK